MTGFAEQKWPRHSGEASQKTGSFDWGQTALGPVHAWDANLKSAIDLALSSTAEMMMLVGPDRRVIFNDTYAKKNGVAFTRIGLSADEFFGDVWGDLNPLFATLFQTGQLAGKEEKLFRFETSPVFGSDGAITAVLAQPRERSICGSQDFALLVLGATSEAFCLVDKKGIILRCNQSYLTMMGYTAVDEVVNKLLTLPKAAQILEAVLQEKSLSGTGGDFTRKNGDAFKADYKVEPILIDGKYDSSICVFSDLTKRIESEEALLKSQRETRDALERIEMALNVGSIVGTWLWDVVEDKVYGDERFAKSFDIDFEVLKDGVKFSNVVQSIHPDDLPRVDALIKKAMIDGQAYTAEYRVRQPDGWLWVEAKGQAEFNDKGELIRFPGLLADINKRKQAEEAELTANAKLAETNKRLRMAQAAGRIGLFSVDVKTSMVSVTPEVCEIFGLPLTEVMHSKDMEDCLHPVYNDTATSTEEDRKRGVSPLSVEYCILRKNDNALRWLARRAEFVRDANGDPIQMMGVVQDITDRKMAEQALLESEAQFRMLAQAMPNQAWTAQPNGLLDWFNEQTYKYSGLTYDDLKDNGWAQIVHPDDLPAAAAEWADKLKSGEKYEIEFRIRRADSVYCWHIIRALPIKRDGVIIRWVGTNTDIEEQKQAIHAMNDARKHLSLMVESAKDYAIISMDREGHIVSWNHGAETIFGWQVSEAIDRHISLIFTPEDIETGTHQRELSMAAKNGKSGDERWHIRKNGERFYVVGTMAAMYNDEGAVSGYIKIARDMTANHEAQEALVNARNAAEAANIAKTEFLANMSHEIRTPMNAVIGLSNILALSQPLTQKQRDFIKTLQLSADSLLVLLNDLLDISKIEARTVELEKIPFNLERVIRETTNILGLRAREKGLSLTNDCSAIKDTTFIGDPTRLRQIIMNICSNAVKFTEAGGVHIAVSYVEKIPGQTCQLTIAVKDTGIGIPADKLDMIFQKFVQADSSINRKYGGTGLGLAITKTLVGIMDGALNVKSVVGQGSVFTVEIPLGISSDEEKADIRSIKEVKAPVSVQGTKKRILLVEDYQANILVASTFIEEFGYECDVATNGADAVAKIKEGTIYTAVLMDVQMYGMNGLDATKAIRQYEQDHQKKRLPIIGMTAHALGGDREKCLEAGMDDYISKPFSPDDLQAKLKAASLASGTV